MATLRKEELRVQYDKELLPCPFCGGKAEIIHHVVQKGSNKTGACPEDAEIYDTKKNYLGTKTITYWHRRKYTPKCTKERCIANNNSKNAVFNTAEEAAQAWNTRF